MIKNKVLITELISTQKFTQQLPLTNQGKSGVTGSRIKEAIQSKIRHIDSLISQQRHKDIIGLHVRIHDKDVLFSFEFSIEKFKYSDSVEVIFHKLSKKTLLQIKKEYAPFITSNTKTELIPNHILENANPFPMLRTITDTNGTPLGTPIIDEITGQRLSKIIPLIVECVAFYRKHENDPEKVEKIYTDTSEGKRKPEGARIYFKSYPELAGKPVKNRKLDEYRADIKRASQPIQMFFQTENYKRKIKRKKPEIGFTLIQAYAIETRPYMLHLSQMLLDIGNGFKRIPTTIRDDWESFPYRKHYHELAYLWSYAKKYDVETEYFVTTVNAFNIHDSKDPKRTIARFESCMDFLKHCHLMLNHTFEETENGAKFTYFFNRHKLQHLRVKNQLELPNL